LYLSNRLHDVAPKTTVTIFYYFMHFFDH